MKIIITIDIDETGITVKTDSDVKALAENCEPAKEKQTFGEAVCPECDEVFEKKTNRQKYCSKTCTAKAARKRLGKAICEECGNEFERNSPRQRFCTPECVRTNTWKKRKSEYTTPMDEMTTDEIKEIISPEPDINDSEPSDRIMRMVENNKPGMYNPAEYPGIKSMIG